MGINGSDEALAFLAPEQMQVQIGAEEWDGRTDEYALAVLAHRLLAAGQVRRSPAFIAVLTMAMSQQPAGRFETIDLFLTALAEVSGGAGTARAERAPVGSCRQGARCVRRAPAAVDAAVAATAAAAARPSALTAPALQSLPFQVRPSLTAKESTDPRMGPRTLLPKWEHARLCPGTGCVF